MRPTPNQLVDGVVRILKDTVAPAVTDEHARAQLQQAIAVLRALDSDDALSAVQTRDEELQDLLRECAQWVNADRKRIAFFGHVASIDVAPATSFDVINDRYEAARAVLESFIVALARWRHEQGPATSQEIFMTVGARLAGSRTT